MVWKKTFTIKLECESTKYRYRQKLVLGINPGNKKIGIAIRKKNIEPVKPGHLETRTSEVGKNLAKENASSKQA